MPARREAEFLRRLNHSLELQAGAIGQALHDDASQLLVAAHLALSEAARGLPPAARERVLDARRSLTEIEEHLRQLAHELRPRILDDMGMIPAIEFLARGFEARRAIRTTVTATGIRPLPHAIETAVYRVTQEGLTNIGRHALATRASIMIEVAPQELRCRVRDNGVGFDAAALAARTGESSLGLFGIRQRLDLLGGQLRIRTARGRGTELVAIIPLEHDAHTPSPR